MKIFTDKYPGGKLSLTFLRTSFPSGDQTIGMDGIEGKHWKWNRRPSRARLARWDVLGDIL
jgi:hypothetical protein